LVAPQIPPPGPGPQGPPPGGPPPPGPGGPIALAHALPPPVLQLLLRQLPPEAQHAFPTLPVETQNGLLLGAVERLGGPEVVARMVREQASAPPPGPDGPPPGPVVGPIGPAPGQITPPHPPILPPPGAPLPGAGFLPFPLLPGHRRRTWPAVPRPPST
jgi:hypothetical protein